MPRKTFVTLCSVALLSAMVLGSAVQAQQDGQRQQRDGGRRGQFGGPGGFGGGGFGGSSFLGLLRIDAVREEIKVTEDQQELVDILNDELREGRPEFPQNYRDLSDAEQTAFRDKMQKWSDEQTAQAKETLKTILDEGQYKRLQEIYVQNQGTRALLDPDVLVALKVTDDQKKQLEATQEERTQAVRDAMRELFQGGGGAGGFDRDAMREKMESLREETDKQMLAHLSDEQKTAFEALKGEKFDMPEGAFFGGRGRGGPGGPGGGPDGGAGRPRRGGDRPQRPE